MRKEVSDILMEGLNNWKLRLILSALLSIIGLGFFISMVIGLFIELSIYDKSLVGIAIFMVGVPTYLILSKLDKIDMYTIAGFLNQNLSLADGKAEVLVKDPGELEEEELSKREELERLFKEKPLYTYLPNKPVKQALILFLFSILGSLLIWLLNSNINPSYF